MVKKKKSFEELSRYLSRVYTSPKHAASFARLNKLYRVAKEEYTRLADCEPQNYKQEHEATIQTHRAGMRSP